MNGFCFNSLIFIFLHQIHVVILYFHCFYYSLACYAYQHTISLHRRSWQLVKENLKDSLFFLKNIFNILVEIMFQPQSLGNINTNTFLSREIIIYSLTLLPVIKPLPYLRQNIFHNNKETNFSNCCLTTYRITLPKSFWK